MAMSGSSSSSLCWIPPTITNVLVRDHLRMQLEFPQYFNKDFPATPCWFVVGRPGLRKHEAVRQAILNAKLPCQVCPMDVSVDHERHGKCMEHVRNIIAAAAANAASAVIIINQGHLLCQSRYPGVMEEFNGWPQVLQQHPNVVIVVCSDITLRELPQPTKIAYQYQQQVFFPCPDEEWRAAFFKHRFASYAAFIADKPRIHVRIATDDDDMIETLVESSAYTTLEELEGFVNKVIRPIHKIDRDPVIVIDEEYCCRYLVDKGGVYNLSEADGYAQEQSFIMSAGIQGIPPLPERTARTITNQAVYDNGGIEPKPPAAAQSAPSVRPSVRPQDESKMHEWGERITFDKDGKEVVLSDNLGKDVMLEPEKKRKKNSKKKK